MVLKVVYQRARLSTREWYAFVGKCDIGSITYKDLPHVKSNCHTNIYNCTV